MEGKQITISLCMIVKNEENTIARCLDSIKGIPNEIIIVDTGSTDRTKEIVGEYTHEVFDFTWIDDFAAARNFAFGKATMEYILWLDADDILNQSDREEFLKLKKNLNPRMDVVNMPYLLAFDQFGNVTFSLRRNRLLKRSKNFRWIGAVHECLEVYGDVLNSDICVTHKGTPGEEDRNLRIYESRKARGELFSPRDLYYYANELFGHQRNNQAIETYQKFLETGEGWVEDEIDACAKLADCFHNLGEKDQELKYSLKSFEYAAPRAEFCCRMGQYFLKLTQYEQGVFWYKLATQLEKPIDSWGPILEACWTWIPQIQLCVCYDKLGKYELAYEHNELARKYRPEDPQVLHNKQYLEGVLGLTPRD